MFSNGFEKGPAPRRLLHIASRAATILAGLAFFALGIIIFLKADLGMNTWAVLDVGITRQTTLSLGASTQITGLAALLAGWALGYTPGVATILSVCFMGAMVDAVMAAQLIPAPVSMLGRVFYLALGVVLFAVGTLLSVAPLLGAGPRDSLMMGLLKRLPYPVSWIRAGLELAVILLGYSLGGSVGWGTLASALLVGPAVGVCFRIAGFDGKAKHQGLAGTLRYLAGDSAPDE